jgi:hypothetical protein
MAEWEGRIFVQVGTMNHRLSQQVNIIEGVAE